MLTSAGVGKIKHAKCICYSLGLQPHSQEVVETRPGRVFSFAGDLPDATLAGPVHGPKFAVQKFMISSQFPSFSSYHFHSTRSVQVSGNEKKHRGIC